MFSNYEETAGKRSETSALGVRPPMGAAAAQSLRPRIRAPILLVRIADSRVR